MTVIVGKPVPGSVYERIQNLENRILQLESVSPEYFDMMVRFIGVIPYGFHFIKI